jgi:N6-L-threonylcarbamoyladenine synthase
MPIDTPRIYEKFRKSDAYKNPDMSLPSPALNDGSLDFSFSGLKTASINLLHKYEQQGKEIDRELFAARYTYEAIEAVSKKISMAMDRYPGYALSISGGVAANSHLRRRLAEVAAAHKSKIFIPPLSLCGDNAAMIAAAGYFEYKVGNVSDSSLNASALDSI